MARITARQALTRARTRREKRREETSRAMEEARTNYIRQLSQIMVPSTGQFNQENKTEQINNSRRNVGRPKKQIANNFKITDYFPVRGRENREMSLPKSPQALDKSKGEVDVITISDSEDNQVPKSLQESDIKSDSSKRFLKQDLKQEVSHGNADLSAGGPLEISTSLRLDQDVEIVTILPPIPLRNHPLFDLEDD